MAIIDDILDISKIEAGMLSIRPQPLAPMALIEQVLDPFQTSVEEKGLRLVFHVDRLLPDQIVGDLDRLRQLIANLIGNAVKFTERGEIVVTADYGLGRTASTNCGSMWSIPASVSTRPIERNCSNRSGRVTCRPPAAMAAPASA